MKSVLLLQSRPEKEASDDEFRAFCRLGKIDESRVVRVQLDRQITRLRLDDYDFVLMGGGPANFAYPRNKKSPEQLDFERVTMDLMNEIVATDKPFLGTCLGVGALVSQVGGQMSFEKGEPVTAVTVSLTSDGINDPLTAGLPEKFDSFVGHKEGVQAIPSHVKVLAESDTCIQLLKVGANVYASQFHTELDPAGLELRINTYKHAGYFEPEEADDLIAAAWRSSVVYPPMILERFVAQYS